MLNFETADGEFAVGLIQPARLARSGGKREEGDDADRSGENPLCGTSRSESPLPTGRTEALPSERRDAGTHLEDKDTLPADEASVIVLEQAGGEETTESPTETGSERQEDTDAEGELGALVKGRHDVDNTRND